MEKKISGKNIYTFLVLKLDYSANWAEDFLLHNLHVSIDASEKRRLDVETSCSLLRSSTMHRCAFAFTGVDVTHNTLSLCYQEEAIANSEYKRTSN